MEGAQYILPVYSTLAHLADRFGGNGGGSVYIAHVLAYLADGFGGHGGGPVNFARVFHVCVKYTFLLKVEHLAGRV